MADIKKTFLIVDILRLTAGIGIFVASGFLPHGGILRPVFLLFIIYPALWIILTQFDIADENRHPALPYLPCTADMMAFTFIFYIMGTLNSVFILVFIFSVIMSSLNVRIRTGRYMAFLSIIAVTGISASVYFGVLPGVNILGGEHRITLVQLVFSLAAFLPVIFLVQGIVYKLTKGIQQSADALFAEKETLKASNDLMERELEMARKIQRHLLPAKAPGPHVNALYLPMHMVGGDFYDYIIFGNDGRTGIFISDVSGHGVPAALITSMIKTAITQAGQVSGDPAGMMRHLNATLYSHTNGNFVTAFYGIYDPATRKLVYSNAGHNPPVLIRGDAVNELACSRSVPLAIGDDDFLKSNNKQYCNDSTTLDTGSKLLLFTDGLTEATPTGDRSRMFEDVLKINLVELGDLTGSEFVAELFSRLVGFRGSENFEDDVCFICVDVV
jgi:serine phosphatase RsbU (regulator of sigma subunit)